MTFPVGRRGDGKGIGAERNSVLFSHRIDLVRASALLRSFPNLDANELEELCTTIERIGASAGLDGPWRTFETQSRVVRLSYISLWDERMPAAKNDYRRHDLVDEFDERLIDGLPDALYLAGSSSSRQRVRRPTEVADGHRRLGPNIRRSGEVTVRTPLLSHGTSCASTRCRKGKGRCGRLL